MIPLSALAYFPYGWVRAIIPLYDIHLMVEEFFFLSFVWQAFVSSFISGLDMIGGFLFNLFWNGVTKGG